MSARRAWGVLGVAACLLCGAGTAAASGSYGGGAGDPRAILALADRADDPDPMARAEALAELMTRRDDLAVGAVARFLGDAHPAVRHRALDYLGAQRSPAAVAYLGAVFQHPDETMRRDAIAWLQAQAHTDHRDAVAEALVPFLADPAKEVRLDALAAVGETGHPSIVPQVARLYDVPDPELRLAAVSSLNHVWDRSSADALVAFVGDEDPRVRKATYQGLAQFGGRTSFELLVGRGLSDADRDVRMGVIDAVADLRLGASVDTLASRFPSADTEEKKALVAALATIGTPDAQLALRQLNDTPDTLDQVIVARIWSETRDRVAEERAQLAEQMMGSEGDGQVTVTVMIDPNYGVWEP